MDAKLGQSDPIPENKMEAATVEDLKLALEATIFNVSEILSVNAEWHALFEIRQKVIIFLNSRSGRHFENRTSACSKLRKKVRRSSPYKLPVCRKLGCIC